MKVRTSQFCALSNNKDWKAWLERIDPELHQELVDAGHRIGCRARQTLMMKIYRELYKRGHGPTFETLIRTRFPYLEDQRHLEKKPEPQPKTVELDSPVFKTYKPHILSFPHKLIMEGNDLERRVKEFVSTKLSADYVIVDGKAYIEYFMPHYKGVINKIPPEKREIHVYKMKQRAAK